MIAIHPLPGRGQITNHLNKFRKTYINYVWKMAGVYILYTPYTQLQTSAFMYATPLLTATFGALTRASEIWYKKVYIGRPSIFICT